jgi:hypothetical protein
MTCWRQRNRPARPGPLALVSQMEAISGRATSATSTALRVGSRLTLLQVILTRHSSIKTLLEQHTPKSLSSIRSPRHPRLTWPLSKPTESRCVSPFNVYREITNHEPAMPSPGLTSKLTSASRSRGCQSEISVFVLRFDERSRSGDISTSGSWNLGQQSRR